MHQRSSIKAVLFDLDGTLFDRDRSVREQIAAQYAAFATLLAHVPHAVFVARFMDLDARGYRKKDEVYQQLGADFGLDEGLAATLFEHFRLHYHDYCHLFQDTRATLDRLQALGLRLGIITNGATQVQHGTLAALRIAHYFAAVLVSEGEGIRKPDAAIFGRAVERLGVQSDEAVFVGDHPQADVDGARRAGLRAIWKRDDYWPSPLAADGIIDTLPDLIPLLLQPDGTPSP